MDLFSEDLRRNPYPMYEQMRAGSPLLHLPALNAFLVFDYDGVKRVLGEHEVFSSKLGPQWLIFFDPPRHEKMRALVSRAFTPRTVAALEQRIRELSRRLLDSVIERGEMDLALDYSVPLPMAVIAEMLGVPAD
jgi:cytochrome P450